MDNVEDAPRHGESRRQGKAFRPRVGVDIAAHGGDRCNLAQYFENIRRADIARVDDEV